MVIVAENFIYTGLLKRYSFYWLLGVLDLSGNLGKYPLNHYLEENNRLLKLACCGNCPPCMMHLNTLNYLAVEIIRYILFEICYNDYFSGYKYNGQFIKATRVPVASNSQNLRL